MSVSKIQVVRIISVLFLFLLFSCTKNESPTSPSNTAPKDIVAPVSSESIQDHVTDYGGSTFEPEYAWRPRSKYIDYMGFTATSVAPANYATGIAVGSQITIVFSKDIDPATLDESSILFDPNIDGTFSYSNRNVIFTPSFDLMFNTLYKVTILSSVSDIAGNSMFENYSWQFTTEEWFVSLRGHYVGRYYVVTDASSSGARANYTNVDWTFTDYGHSCNTTVAEGQDLNLCSFSGDYVVEDHLAFSNTQKLGLEVCDETFMPTGYFQIQWIQVDDGNDTLVLKQLDAQNDIRYKAIIEKQE